jgi:hypothetical protein
MLLKLFVTTQAIPLTFTRSRELMAYYIGEREIFKMSLRFIDFTKKIDHATCFKSLKNDIYKKHYDLTQYLYLLKKIRRRLCMRVASHYAKRNLTRPTFIEGVCTTANVIFQIGVGNFVSKHFTGPERVGPTSTEPSPSRVENKCLNKNNEPLYDGHKFRP